MLAQTPGVALRHMFLYISTCANSQQWQTLLRESAAKTPYKKLSPAGNLAQANSHTHSTHDVSACNLSSTLPACPVPAPSSGNGTQSKCSNSLPPPTGGGKGGIDDDGYRRAEAGGRAGAGRAGGDSAILQMCWGMFEPPALLDVPSPLSYSPRSSECSTDGSVESVTRDFEVICVRACGWVALLLADATACARRLTVFLAQSLTYISCDDDDHDEMMLPGGECQSEARPPSAAARRPPGAPRPPRVILLA